MDFQPFTKDKAQEVCEALAQYEKVELNVTAPNGWTTNEVVSRCYETLNRRGDVERYEARTPAPRNGSPDIIVRLTSEALWRRVLYWAKNETEYRILTEDNE